MTLTMTEQEAIKYILEYLEVTKESRSSVAKKLDISPSALTTFLNGSYPSPHTIIPKVVAFSLMEEKKEYIPVKPSFQRTYISNDVINTIEYCKLHGSMGIFYGDAGIGKTEGAKEFIKNNPESILITINPVFATIKGVSKLICNGLRISDYKTNMDAYSAIVRKLKDSKRVVVVDEAQHLTIKTLEHLRSMIVDDAECGLVLIGNETIYNRMLGKQEAQLAQLFSRVAIRKNVTTNDVRIDDIKILFPLLGEKEQGFLYKVSNNSKWGIRGAVNLFMNSSNNKDTSYQGIVAMAKFMGIGI